MLSVVHAPTGAFFAAKLVHPLVFIPVAVGVHYLQDWIPHWDVGEKIGHHPHARNIKFVWGVVDLLLGLAVVYWLWQHGSSSFEWYIWLGVIAGLLPDFIEAPLNFLGWDLKILRPLNTFHERFHNSTSNFMLGLTPQILLLIIMYVLR